MKIVNPLVNGEKCQFEGCIEKATARLFGKTYCRLHYVFILHNWRNKRNGREENLTFLKCAKCNRKINKEFSNFYNGSYFCLNCVKIIGEIK